MQLFPRAHLKEAKAYLELKDYDAAVTRYTKFIDGFGLEGHTGWIGAVAFSPDGRRIVSGSRDHTTKVWGVTSGEQLLTLKADDTRILSATFSLDGRRIFTVSGERAVHVWAATTAKQVAAWQTEEETAKERQAA